MILSRTNLGHINANVEKPEASCFELPEKVLQFGTGVLLRGLPNYYIDKANKQHIFNGRIVVVKSTRAGGTDAFEAQDNLYTHYIRGVENGVKKESSVINASISRVLTASIHWENILALAASADMKIIISNTTEVGLTYLAKDSVTAMPPVSFPGKLLSFLYKRYLVFNGSTESGMVIIPTELIPDNGSILKDICVKLAHDNNLDQSFITWLTTANDFCNSLVDRIVPGALNAKEREEAQAANGYEDNLAILSEIYGLWAIETSKPQTREVLSFYAADSGVVICDNINKFRELKLRLLNATHTLTCGLAVISDFKTVKEAMSNTFFESFITTLMDVEITGAITSNEITEEDAMTFAAQLRDRFRNPFIEHLWLSITMQYSSKMLMRVVPVLVAYYKRYKMVPKHIAIGFGAYILFMQSKKNEDGTYTGYQHGKSYLINDDKAGFLYEHWQHGGMNKVVQETLADTRLWNTDLTQLPGFEKAVYETVKRFSEEQLGNKIEQSTSLYSI
ncbi:MAG: tagaturonate reductase [Flavipsychrobacter sp.]|nr:tagaturonate reductase [Flavipsychrobacter sp.]